MSPVGLAWMIYCVAAGVWIGYTTQQHLSWALTVSGPLALLIVAVLIILAPRRAPDSRSTGSRRHNQSAPRSSTDAA